MGALLIHSLIFAFAVGAAGVLFSLTVRQVAEFLGYPASATWRRLPISVGVFAIAGLLGQLAFAVCQLFGTDPVARLGGWLVSSALTIQGVRWITPYMPLRRSLVVGVLAGLGGWLGFHGALIVLGSELAAQLCGLATMLTVFSFAVVFPNPDPVPAAPCVHDLIAPRFPVGPATAPPARAAGLAKGFGKATVFHDQLSVYSEVSYAKALEAKNE